MSLSKKLTCKGTGPKILTGLTVPCQIEQGLIVFLKTKGSGEGWGGGEEGAGSNMT
jgi:hypothetical protein